MRPNLTYFLNMAMAFSLLTFALDGKVIILLKLELQSFFIQLQIRNICLCEK
jgi:hypothetical protein